MARPRRRPFHPRLADYRTRHWFSQEDVAEKIGISTEMVRLHEQGRSLPSPHNRRRYCMLYRATEVELGLAPDVQAPDHLPGTATVDVDQLVAEISHSGTSDDAIERLERTTADLARLHTRAPARQVLRQVLRLQSNAHAMLGGPIRLGQARDVYRIESQLLAHSCLLLSDLKQDAAAYRHGMAGLRFAQEAGTNDAINRSALAKTLRWMDRLVESADMAAAGYVASPMTPIRLQLASYEANAAALLGDATRARAVLRRVDEEAGSCSTDGGGTAWSFPPARQAVFALSVATQGRDPDAVLRAAAIADDSWAAGEPLVKANWAQIRVGAGIAHLDLGDLEAAIAEVRPVLDLPPELRVATVTAYTARLSRRLRTARFRRDRTARDLLSDIHTFTVEALPPDPAEET